MTATTSERPAAPTGEPVIEAAGATMRYGGVLALDDVSLDLRAGEVHGVIGPNGAGKTTLFDVLSGVRRPTSGTVRMAGDDVSGRSAAWRSRHGLRRTFQRQQVFGALTVADNLRTAVEGDRRRGGVLLDLVGASGWRGDGDADARVEQMLERCHLGPIRDLPAGSLPIGAARMVELARALIGEPTVLLLDEPTSGLGEAETELMGAAIRDVVADGRCGVLLVEHDVPFVMGLSTRITVLDLGRTIATGTPEQVRDDPAVIAAYLG